MGLSQPAVAEDKAAFLSECAHNSYRRDELASTYKISFSHHAKFSADFRLPD